MPEGFNLGTAFATIELNTDAIANGIASAKKTISSGLEDIGKSIQDFGGGLQSIGANMTAIGAPFLAFGAVAVKAFSDSQKAASQLDAVLKSTNGSAGVTRQAALDLASGLQKVTMFSDETVLSAENMLLTFTNIGKNVFPEATKTVLDMSQALGQDTKSSAIQLGKALNDPIKGITALQRVGVTFTESQKALIEQLVKAGKVEEAQKVILAELTKEFGGSAEAAGKTFAGQLEITKNKLDDMMETIGERLLPIVQRFIDGISGLVDWFSNLDPHIQDVIVGIGALLASFAIIGPIIAGVGAAISAVGGILAGIGTVIGVILSPIGLLIAAGALLVAVFRDQIGAGIQSVLSGLQQGVGIFEAIGAAILDVFGTNPITLWIANTLVSIQNFFNNWQLNWSLIKLYAEYYTQGVVTAIQNVIAKIGEFIANNQTLVEGILVVGAVMLIATGISWLLSAGMAAVAAVVAVGGTLLTGIGAFIALLTGPIGLVALLIALMGAIVLGYPGGLPGVLNDAADAFVKIGGIVDLSLIKFFRDLGDAIHFFNGEMITLASIGMPGVTAKYDPNLVLRPGLHGPGKNDSGGIPVGGGPNGSIGARANLGVVPIPPVGGGSAAPRASGGNIWAGMPYLTGERGPELITAGVNGTVHNAEDTAKMLGGFTWNGDMNITANDYAGGRMAARGALDEIEERYRSRGN